MRIQKLKNVANLFLLILIVVFFPVSLLAQTAPVYRASGNFTARTGAITPPYPATMVADDVCLLVVESENQAIALTTANGFVEVPSWSPQSAGPAGVNPASRLAVFWKRTVGGDAAPVVTDSGNHTTGQIHCFSGVITSDDPWDTGAGGNDGGANDTTGTIPGSTTTVANTLVVLITSSSFNGTSTTQCSGWANADLASLTERTDNTNTAGLGGGHCLATGTKASAGVYATTTVTLANTSYKGAISLALKPPPVMMSTIYAINAAAIYRINPANSVATIVYNSPPFAPGTQATSLAQCPDGMLYYVENSVTSRLYQFNPNTPAVAPTPIGTGLGTGISNMLRMTCYPTPTVPTGQLYGMYTTPDNLYTIDKGTGVATAIPLTLPSTTQPIEGSGDIAFDANGTLYYVGQSDTPGGGGADSVRLWIINLATNTFENVGAVTGLPNVANGIAFDNSGNVLLSLTTETRLYTVSADGGAATPIGATGAMSAVFDLSSVNVLKLTKTDNSTLVRPSDIITYTVTLTAAGAAVNNAVFRDPAIADLNVISVICAASGGATCPASVTVGGMQGAGLTIPSMPISSSVTFTITAAVASNPTTSMLINTATVTLSGQTNSASDTTIIKKARIIKWREVTQ